MFFRGSFSWPLFTVFIIFFLLFCWEVRKPIRAILFYEKTQGIIQSAEYVPPSVSKTNTMEINRTGTFTHQAVFTSPSGTTHQVFTRVKSNPPAFNIGDMVSVYYNADNPNEAMIGGFLELWFGSLALGFFLLIFFILWFGALVESTAHHLQ
ncbi:DUF3592 domain-containing protein [Patescibacteria group bacterium]|nr:DUF3592 domain-containing protein [Patescibacteria group bacterium]